MKKKLKINKVVFQVKAIVKGKGKKKVIKNMNIEEEEKKEVKVEAEVEVKIKVEVIQKIQKIVEVEKVWKKEMIIIPMMKMGKIEIIEDIQ